MDERTDAQELEHAAQAWRRYVDTGRVDPGLLRSCTYLSWQRCAQQGTDPHTVRWTTLSGEETAVLLERERDLIAAARPYLRALSRSARAHPHAALLSDSRGYLLDVVGDMGGVIASARGLPAPGTLLSEAVAGSNGIGTALAQNDYVEIVGPEHFVEQLWTFTCQAVPLRGPAAQTCIGAVSIGVMTLHAAERVREILFCAARGIEAELGRRRIEALEANVVCAVEGDPAGAPPRVDELRHDLVQLQAAARLRLDAAAQIAGTERPEAAEPIVRAADALVRRFERQAKLWMDLASDEVVSARPVDVDDYVDRMLELFETESNVRGVRVVAGERSRVLALVDPRALSRFLFKGLLNAFRTASKGATVVVDARAEDAQVTIAFGTGDELRLPVPRAGSASTCEGR